MRKGDLELLEMRLEPHSRSLERHESEIASNLRYIKELGEKVKDLERNEQVHKTEIAQGLASIRSLLQRANRAAREQGIIESDDDDLPVADSEPEVKVPRSADQVWADARAGNRGRSVL